MRINVYNFEFHALQSSGMQFSLLKNKAKILASTNTTNTNTEYFNFNPYYLLALHF